jgi:hypothetical protein
MACKRALESKALTPSSTPALAFSSRPIQSENSPSAIAAMPDDTKIEPFKPPQPHIPGVPAVTAEREAPDQPSGPPVAGASLRAPARHPAVYWIGAASGVAVIIVAAVAWQVHSSSAQQPSAPVAVEEAVPAPEPAKPLETLPVGPGEIASANEMTKPWSSMRFIFRNPITSVQTPAIAVRLPGGALWGISLVEPYGTCQLEYVTDLAQIRSQYGLAAQHPMVVDPCTRSVFDLARYSSGPNGLVRGEIIRGRAVRPPIGIEVVARGNHIVVVRME